MANIVDECYQCPLTKCVAVLEQKKKKQQIKLLALKI